MREVHAADQILETRFSDRRLSSSGSTIRKLLVVPLKLENARDDPIVTCASHLPAVFSPNWKTGGVVGSRNNKGQVLCSLFSSAIAFPQKDDKAVAHYTAEISDRQASCEFSGIAPGTYAVSAFHDENSNGKLDTNFMGIPREGVAASNDARGRLGPPKFNDAAFQVSGDQVNLRITVTYLKAGRV
jgi:uncharacterized protein (DUF2141 family)